MKILKLDQLFMIAGGLSNEEIGNKVTDGLDKTQEVIDEGRDNLADQLDKLTDKIHKD
ncbi:hypothetical protein [Candidatus Berkiella aquae]|uniref:Uncharacterized protein n=1 Tax=Candidatus Berkiella aquae TaxID=295108 RepID=A0A0Q9YEG1_9GAMM|nr:hypothetical protein [Candidatus Berkiella aquae]MCS5711638.1 hypothetical protein [Candidatus Berkiella aquae]